MASKKEVKEVDYVSKQANLTAQVESERQAAKKWWDEYGMVYLDDAKPEDFTYDNRIQVLKNKLAEDKYARSDPVWLAWLAPDLCLLSDRLGSRKRRSTRRAPSTAVARRSRSAARSSDACSQPRI